MNQDEAKELVKIGLPTISFLTQKILSCGLIGLKHIKKNWHNIEIFAEKGEMQILHVGQWITKEHFTFDCSPESYRPVPDREINWGKAMKNGAWGEEFLFSDARSDTGYAGKLTGYNPNSDYGFVNNKGECYKCIAILYTFTIPESWYDEGEKNERCR